MSDGTTVARRSLVTRDCAEAVKLGWIQQGTACIVVGLGPLWGSTLNVVLLILNVSCLALFRKEGSIADSD